MADDTPSTGITPNKYTRSDFGVSAYEEHLQILKREIPDYDQWTPGDLSNLIDDDLRIIRSVVGAGQDWSGYIPQSFHEAYGEYAYIVFMNGIYSEAASRDLEAGFEEGLLRGLYRTKFNLTSEQMEEFRADLPHNTRTSTGRTISQSPAERFNYAIIAAANADDDTPFIAEVTIPRPAAVGLFEANPTLLPEEVTRVGYNLELGDAAAFDSGYMTRMGLSRGMTADPIPLPYDPEAASANMPAIAAMIVHPGMPPIDVKTAWQAGWILADMTTAQSVAEGEVYSMRAELLPQNRVTPEAIGISAGGGGR